MFSRLSRLFESQRIRLLRDRRFTPLGPRPDLDYIRNSDWTTNVTPNDLLCRHVELTGPGNDAKMVIHAMNSEANGYMLDLEDSMAPTVKNVSMAHENIRKVISGTLSVQTPEKTYRMKHILDPTFHVRARGLHLPHHDGGSAMLYDIAEFLEGSAHNMMDR